MNSFIGQIATHLYQQHGDDISSLNVLFPTRRARLFFGDALSQLSDKPLWQPTYLTIDDLMDRLSGLTPSDPVRLITELYKVYSTYHDEPFDTFYFWGEMLLADFDAVDKYLIDPHVLFSNVAELKEMESDVSYLTPEQIEIISRFWSTFSATSSFSREQEHFLKIWRSLEPIYHTFRERLLEQGMAYTGMMYRRAAERIKAKTAPALDPRRYVVAGFNALSKCEKRLFDHLKNNYQVDFFWDYDNYYVRDAAQEAGLFLRENITRFPMQQALAGGVDGFAGEKKITIVSAPSDSLQCRYVYDFLEELSANGAVLGKETAVVLTDENLMLPVLYSIPPSVESVNITMGYPLRQTLAYSFIERLIELQHHRKSSGGREVFYHDDVTGLLSHPYVLESDSGLAQSLAAGVVHRQSVYVECEKLRGGAGLISKIFAAPASWSDLGEYLLGVVSVVAGRSGAGQVDQQEHKQRIEYFLLIAEHIRKLINTLGECQMELTPKIFTSLLRSTLQSLRIPYQGEPLLGVQIMGILETRNLDFENVVILSMNDDTFPGNRATSISFIPYNLRVAYGLPTPTHHEGVFAYYFYRLLQRAKNVHLVYSSRSDDKHTGEPSRYLHQLRYESPFEIAHKQISLDVNLTQVAPITVEKSGDVALRLERFLTDPTRKLSPSSFYNYVECPLKFYFRSVAGLRVDQELTEQVDSPMFGSILHNAMELLYTDLIGNPAPQSSILALVGSPDVDQAVDQAIHTQYLKGEKIAADEYGGNLLLIKEIITKYINTCLLPYDGRQSQFTVWQLEKQIECEFSFGSNLTVRFGGLADRLDRVGDRVIRIVDYKTGQQRLEFKGIEALFSPNPKDRNSAALQMMLYSMIIARSENIDAQPALYFVRNLNTPSYSPLLQDKELGAEVTHFYHYKSQFEELLSQMLGEMFDSATPFRQCDDPVTCGWCDFREICRR